MSTALLQAAAYPKKGTARETLLEVEGLRTVIDHENGPVPVVDDIQFSIRRGGTLALVGETGSGKSTTAAALLRLIPTPGRIVGGRILLNSRKVGALDLTTLPSNDRRLYSIRGGVVALVPQEPLSALSPVHTIGAQISEMLELHTRASRREARERSLEMLERVGLKPAVRVYSQYPHQLSGGMRQRALIAMALVAGPELLIADEPTTALDVSTQAAVLGLLKSLQQELSFGLLLITHDMGVVAKVADEVAVMYYGRIVEKGSVESVLTSPLHPYTRGLLRSLPAMSKGGRLIAIPGSAPSLFSRPSGCAFHARCERAVAGACDATSQELIEAAPGHLVACERTGGHA